MEGDSHDNRLKGDHEYQKGLMTGLLIMLADKVDAQWSTAIIIAALAILAISLRRGC